MAMVTAASVAAPFKITLGEKVIDGRPEFAALTVVASGTRSNAPESASKATTSPELNFH